MSQVYQIDVKVGLFLDECLNLYWDKAVEDRGE